MDRRFPVSSRGVLTALCVTALALSSGTLPAQNFTITDLGSQFPYAVNNQGIVVGSTYPLFPLRAFIWQNGTQTNLGTLGGELSTAYAVNQLGNITGYATTKDNFFHPFFYSTAGGMVDLFPAVANHVGYGFGINDSNVVAGQDLRNQHAFTLSGNTYTDLGTLGGAGSAAYAINNSGTTVGTSLLTGNQTQRAFRKLVGQNMVALSNPSGFTGPSVANGMNNAGVAVGAVGDADFNLLDDSVNTALLWNTSGQVTNLGNGTANSINTKNQVVISNGETGGATLWASNVRKNLNDLIPSDSGWSLDKAYFINDNSWIVGVGTYFNGTEVILKGYLLIPSEPFIEMSGTVTLLECKDLHQTVTFEFRPQDGTSVFTQAVQLTPIQGTNKGTFKFKGAPAKKYKIGIKGSRWLQKVVDVDASGGNVSGIVAVLIAGDCNNDNRVDLLDLDRLALAFNSEPFDPIYDPNCDLNCDSFVDIFDLAVLADYFGQIGDR